MAILNPGHFLNTNLLAWLVILIFNNLPTADALKHLIQIYNTLVFQCQNANAEAGHLESLFTLFLCCLYYYYYRPYELEKKLDSFDLEKIHYTYYYMHMEPDDEQLL